jgi:hypothetical protein
VVHFFGDGTYARSPAKILRLARECPSKNFKQHWSVFLENGGTVTRFRRECNNISRMKQNSFALNKCCSAQGRRLAAASVAAPTLTKPTRKVFIAELNLSCGTPLWTVLLCPNLI